MKNSRFFLVGWFILIALPALSQAGTDAGQARYIPWSGYWWPIRYARMMEPLRKYDAITGRNAAAWEYRAKPPMGAQRWWGYCHAWSAASILEREPRSPRDVTGPVGRSATFGVGDQKGLLTVAHDADPCNVYGRRFMGRGGDDPQDIYPDVLWKCLRLYVKQKAVPLIIDASPGVQVWNYPVYAYQVSYRPMGGGQQLARMKLLMADDNVPPGFLGTRVKAKTYLFTFRLDEGSVVMGSGRWVGASVRDHPDFAWYPLMARPRNPDVSYRAVRRIVAGTGSRDPDDIPPRSDDEPPPPLPRELAEIEARQVIPVSALELVSLLANQVQPAFRTQLTAAPPQGGRAAVGEPYAVRGTSERDGFLYLLHLTPDGDVRLLFPLEGQDNKIVKGKPFELGRTGTKVQLVLPAPAGKHRIAGLVTQRPLLLGQREPPETETGAQIPGRLFRWEPDERLVAQDLLKEAFAGRLTPQKLQEETGIDLKELLKEFGHGEAALNVAGSSSETPREE